MKSEIKCPNVTVKLTNESVIASGIIDRTITAMRNAGISEKVRNEYIEEAESGTYHHLLQTTLRYVNVK